MVSLGDFTVITRASNRESSALFEKTAERFGLPLVILTGTEPLHDVGGYIHGIEALQSFSTKFAIVTDAFDVLVVRWNPEEMAREIEDAIGNVIVSGEPECWPAGPWGLAYKAWESRTPWPYICAGQYCGYREQVLAMMQEIYDRRDTQVAGGGSQELLHVMFAEGYPLTVDRDCRIFQCMRCHPAQYVEKRNGYAFNTITRTRPMFLHFNGKAPGMKEWAEYLAS